MNTLGWDHAMIRAVYGNKSTIMFIDLINNTLNVIIFLIITVCSQIFINLHRCTETAALIYIKCHQAALTALRTPCLLFKRQKKILFQSPVQKCTNLAHLFDFQYRCFSQFQLWLQCCGHQSVLRITINKYFNLITDLAAFRHIFGR